MGIITWIIFGALAGWLASIITGRNRQMGCIANIVVGGIIVETGCLVYLIYLIVTDTCEEYR